MTFAIGYYIKWRGFTDLLWIAISLEFLSILAVIFLLKTSNAPIVSTDETTPLLVPHHDNRLTICQLLNVRLLLIINSYIFHLLVLAAMTPLLFYLLSSPFYWSSVDIGNFSAVSLISTAIFSIFGMKILNLCGAADALICAFGHVCFFGYTLCIALAKHSWQLYIALTIHPFSIYQNSLTISMISKLVQINERNHIFTIITEINTIILAFGSSLANWIYAQTVSYEKNFLFLCASGLCIIPFVLNL